MTHPSADPPAATPHDPPAFGGGAFDTTDAADVALLAPPPPPPPPPPADANAHRAHRAQRNRRLKMALLVAVCTKPLALLTPLVTMPLYLRYLGKEGYGVYESIVSFAMLLSLTNLGLHFGLVNRLIDCHVSGDRQLARRYVSSLMIAASGLVAVVALLWTVIVIAVPWGHMLHIDNPRWAAQAPWVAWLTGGLTLLNFVLAVPAAIYAGYSENATGYAWDAVNRVATLVACVAVVYTRWGLIGVALATCAVQAVVSTANTLTVFRQKPWLRPRLDCFEWRLVRVTLGEGVYLFAITGAITLLFQCDKLIIGVMLTPADVAMYSVAVRPFIAAYGLFMVILAPMWSAHGEALRRGDWGWARKGLHLSVGAGLATVGTCLIVLVVAGDWVFRHWTRGQVTHVPRSLLCAVGCMFLSRAWVDSRGALLNGAGVLRPQAALFIAHAAANLIVALALARPYGLAGIAWATPLTALATTTWGYPWLVRRFWQRIASPGAGPAPLNASVGQVGSLGRPA